MIRGIIFRILCTEQNDSGYHFSYIMYRFSLSQFWIQVTTKTDTSMKTANTTNEFMVNLSRSCSNTFVLLCPWNRQVILFPEDVFNCRIYTHVPCSTNFWYVGIVFWCISVDMHKANSDFHSQIDHVFHKAYSVEVLSQYSDHYLSHRKTQRTFLHVHPTKTQISLRIYAV